jgi:hypothetical protein
MTSLAHQLAALPEAQRATLLAEMRPEEVQALN